MTRVLPLSSVSVRPAPTLASPRMMMPLRWSNSCESADTFAATAHAPLASSRNGNSCLYVACTGVCWYAVFRGALSLQRSAETSAPSATCFALSAVFIASSEPTLALSPAFSRSSSLMRRSLASYDHQPEAASGGALFKTPEGMRGER